MAGKPSRRPSPSEVLAWLSKNGGVIRAAASHFKLPETTIRRWRDKAAADPAWAGGGAESAGKPDPAPPPTLATADRGDALEATDIERLRVFKENVLSHLATGDAIEDPLGTERLVSALCRIADKFGSVLKVGKDDPDGDGVGDGGALAGDDAVARLRAARTAVRPDDAG